MFTKKSKLSIHFTSRFSLESLKIDKSIAKLPGSRSEEPVLSIRIGENDEKTVSLTPEESDELAQFLLKINW